MPTPSLHWYYWLVTLGLLAVGLAGWAPAFYLAMALCCAQTVHFARRMCARAFPVQVRLVYLGLLILGQWAPVIYWIQLVGTWATVFMDYCLTARLVALLPWNRGAPLSLGLVRGVLFSRPVGGSILQLVQGAPAYGCGCTPPATSAASSSL